MEGGSGERPERRDEPEAEGRGTWSMPGECLEKKEAVAEGEGGGG